jgi:MFS family permease
VLHYSAIQTGAAFATTTVTIIVFSNVAQMLVTRLGVRVVLTTGMLVSAAALGLLTQLSADGHYLSTLLPAYLLSGIGMAFGFVPMTIAGLTGVSRADAGIASGLINTSRQIGGAVGIAAVSTIAATATHGNALTAAAATHLTDGFAKGFDVLTGLALAAALISAVFIAPAPRPVEESRRTEALEPLEEAA